MRHALLIGAALAVLAAPARAQVSFSVVVRDESGRGLANVELTFPTQNRKLTTDSVGRAKFVDLERGSYYLRARRVGFEPTVHRVHVDDDSPEFSIVMKSRVVSLDTIKVVEKCPWRGFSGFECRQRLGTGVFIDYVAIDSSHVDDVAKLFYDRPGFKVLRRNVTGIPYVTSTAGWRCLVEIVDGLPISPNNRMPLYADELIGVEAYPEGKLVPKAYEQYSWKGKYRCALINYWTPRGTRR